MMFSSVAVPDDCDGDKLGEANQTFLLFYSLPYSLFGSLDPSVLISGSSFSLYYLLLLILTFTFSFISL